MEPWTSAPGFSGAVLAGGRSRRMGRDKATLRVAGEPMLTRQVRLLQEAGANEVLISHHPDRPLADLGYLPNTRWVLDPPGEIGPLGGLGEVLRTAKFGRVLVVAIDLPALTTGFLRNLLASSTMEIGAVCRSGTGWEPLVAVYPRRALVAIDTAIASNEWACQAVVQRGLTEGWLAEFHPQPEALAELTNWNYPDDFRDFL